MGKRLPPAPGASRSVSLASLISHARTRFPPVLPSPGCEKLHYVVVPERDSQVQQNFVAASAQHRRSDACRRSVPEGLRPPPGCCPQSDSVPTIRRGRPGSVRPCGHGVGFVWQRRSLTPGRAPPVHEASHMALRAGQQMPRRKMQILEKRKDVGSTTWTNATPSRRA